VHTQTIDPRVEGKDKLHYVLFCEVKIDSIPAGADVYIDNDPKSRGKTNQTFKVANRLFHVKLLLAGYQTVSAVVDPRQQRMLTYPLKPAGAAEVPLIAAMQFVRVPKGTFWMSDKSKNAQKQVTIDADFELAAYTVTQGQWEAVMAKNPSHFSRWGMGKKQVKDIADEELRCFPVENVSWDDVQVFLAKLNEKLEGRGWTYRLPTDAEWEYACRGGATAKEECSFDFYFDQPTNDLSSTQANFNGNSPAGQAEKGPYLQRPTKVGSYAPNKLGLFDMHGNVWQWCSDSAGLLRVIRGSGWSGNASNCRAADRGKNAPSTRNYALGFRLCRVASGAK
jgi:formylglycine-generating enzyme required for sulfatase activity